MSSHRSQQEKLALLELARKLNNVSAACKALDFSRDSYYRIKKAYEAGGIHALNNKNGDGAPSKIRIPDEIEKAIIDLSLQDPTMGKQRISEILESRGVRVSPTGVRNVWNRNGLSTIKDRTATFLDHACAAQCPLTEHEVRFVKKAIRSRSAGPGDTQRDESLQKRLCFESLIAELSALFINLPVDRIDTEIEKGLQRVCNFLGLQRSLFSEFSMDQNALVPTHIWNANGITKRHPLSLTGEWHYFAEIILRGDAVVFSHYDELPRERLGETVRHYFQKIGVSSVAAFPFNVGKRIIGCVSWESFGVRIHWTDEVVDRLRLISEVFANTLSRKRTETALRESIDEIRLLKDQLQAENVFLMDEIRAEHHHHRIVGKSNAIQRVLAQVCQVATTTSTVLIQGETGTGKELMAHAIHDASPRKERPMLKVNCSALPATLVESELFGHEKGAFSGADRRRVGRFEAADGGTLFLDEIGDFPLALQPKLLRVLQEGQFERLGSSETITVDVRVIAATNRDLKKAVREGAFRQDLYYRLNIFPVSVPPLRDRSEDIPLLVKAFVRELSSPMGRTIDNIPATTITGLQKYPWPGNVRELKNLVERAMIISKGRTLHIRIPEAQCDEPSMFGTLDEAQRCHILKAIEACQGRIGGSGGAAELLGVPVSTLRSRMKRLRIQHGRTYS